MNHYEKFPHKFTLFVTDIHHDSFISELPERITVLSDGDEVDEDDDIEPANRGNFEIDCALKYIEAIAFCRFKIA